MPAFYGLAALTSRGPGETMQVGASDRREWRMANGEWGASIRHSPFSFRSLALAALAGACALALSACNPCIVGPCDPHPYAGLSCVDDSARCIDQRQATLKVLLDDKSRAWVKEAPTAHAHASGVRLFAFRASKAALSCEELAHGRREAEAAPKALKSHPGISPAQISRATMLAAEVQRELAAELKRRRCRA
jgi:hypothetical protein